MECVLPGSAIQMQQPYAAVPQDMISSPNESLVNEQKNNIQPLYFKVYLKNLHNQEKGHFIVGVELMTRLYLQLKARGYQIKDVGINGSRIRPDLAISKKFHDYLLKNKIEVFAKCDKDDFYDEKEEKFNVRQYLNELLPIFVEYFENIWLVEESVKYFECRDPDCLKYLVELIEGNKRYE